MSQSQGSEVRPSRRTIARGAAWAVPVIAVSAAAPALAASGGPLVFTGISCKGPGQSGSNSWTYFMQTQVTLQEPATITIVSIAECGTGDPLTGLRAYRPDGSLVGDSWNQGVGTSTYDLAGDSTNSRMTCFTVVYTINGQEYVGVYEFGEFKPCCTAASGNYCPPAAD